MSHAILRQQTLPTMQRRAVQTAPLLTASPRTYAFPMGRSSVARAPIEHGPQTHVHFGA